MLILVLLFTATVRAVTAWLFRRHFIMLLIICRPLFR